MKTREEIANEFVKMMVDAANERDEAQAAAHHMARCRELAGVPDDETLAEWIKETRSLLQEAREFTPYYPVPKKALAFLAKINATLREGGSMTSDEDRAALNACCKVEFRWKEKP